MASDEETPAQGGNIKIYMRIRPTKKVGKKYLEVSTIRWGQMHMSKASGYLEINDMENSVEFNLPREMAAGLVNNSRTNYKFKFDGLIGMETNQEDVFSLVGSPCVLNAMEGFNSTIFAYGQTGSGKTFTITGGAERYVDRGIIPRSLSLVFSEIKKRNDSMFQCHISYLEIYNNNGYDLLDPNTDTKNTQELPKVTMLEDEYGNCHLRNLTMHQANTEEEALNLLFLGDTNRAISSTAMNLVSSRSHCIFTISLESRKTNSEVILRSKLHLVDLAGSERVHKTSATGQTLKEAKFINTSLHFLEMVIVALQERDSKNRAHIPYRNSMMTSVLRDSLGGNCKTAMIATVSAEKDQTEESISTCRFAQRVARVKNDAYLNEELDPKIVIRRLQGEIATLKEEINFLKGDTKEGDELTEYESNKLKQLCFVYVDNMDPLSTLNIGEITYTRIRACFQFLKQFYLESKNQGKSIGKGGDTSNEEVEDLRLSLQQRDNEIAILVDLVKKGKCISDLSPQSIRMPTTRVNDELSPTSLQSSTKGSLQEKKLDFDPKWLNDAEKAFEAFCKHYPKYEIMNDNKSILKEKYSAAKATGEAVNRARSNIKLLKEKLEMLSPDDEQDRSEEEQDTTRQEQEKILQLMDIEKFEYKKQYNILRELKSEIEHLQKMLEKSRIAIQQDFDVWYEKMSQQYNKKGVQIPSSTKIYDSTLRTPQKTASSYSTSADQAFKSSSSTINSIFQQQKEIPSPTSKAFHATKVAKSSTSTTRSTPTNPTHVMDSPRGSKILTGDKNTDDDILAFYKAKEELMRRKQHK